MRRYLFIMLAAVSLPSIAGNPYKGEIRVRFQKTMVSENDLRLGAVIMLDSVKLDRNQIVILTPKVVSADGAREIELGSVAISGKRRARMISRANYFGQEGPDTSAPDFHILSRRNPTDSIVLRYDVAAEQWMDHARFRIYEQTYGCYGCQKSQTYPDGTKLKIYNAYLGPLREPVFQPSFIIPPVEPLKIRSESYASRLQFELDRSELLWDFASNAEILSEVDRLVLNLKTDTLINLRGVTVYGYASPEGPADNNLKLARDRAEVFADYLRHRYGFGDAGTPIRSRGFGEDWGGLRSAVAGSALSEKQEVIDIIDNTRDTEQRKKQLEALRSGKTYRFLLENYYPPLRRNEFVFEYEVRNFIPREAGQLIWERPELLSLNEMFAVAQSYRPGSEEFGQIFRIAVRQFPESQVARFNAAAATIDDGDYAVALNVFMGFVTPESHNNMGIVYWRTGQYEQAVEMFRIAAAAGNEQAAANLEIINAAQR